MKGKCLHIYALIFLLFCSCEVAKQKSESDSSAIHGSRGRGKEIWLTINDSIGSGKLTVKVSQDSNLNLYVVVFDSIRRHVYGSAAIASSEVDTAGGVVKRYMFSKNQRVPTYVINTFVKGSTFGATNLLFIWHSMDGMWHIRKDDLTRSYVRKVSGETYFEIVDAFPNQEEHVYTFENGNLDAIN